MAFNVSTILWPPTPRVNPSSQVVGVRSCLEFHHPPRLHHPTSSSIFKLDCMASKDSHQIQDSSGLQMILHHPPSPNSTNPSPHTLIAFHPF